MPAKKPKKAKKAAPTKKPKERSKAKKKSGATPTRSKKSEKAAKVKKKVLIADERKSSKSSKAKHAAKTEKAKHSKGSKKVATAKKVKVKTTDEGSKTTEVFGAARIVKSTKKAQTSSVSARDVDSQSLDEVVEHDDDETLRDAALIDLDGPEDEFDHESVDSEDLSNGYSATIPAREIDVDEDTEGDEVPDAGGDEPMTEFEAMGESSNAPVDEANSTWMRL